MADILDKGATIAFLKEIEKFKTCERDCRTTGSGRPESDAEHSWHLAVFLMLLEPVLVEIDFLKLIKMALIHDLPELYAGDTNPYRGDTANKEKKEKAAAKRLFSMLPDDLAGCFAALFNEYMAQESPEARIVKAADKLMPLIQNLCTNEHHSAYRARKVTYEEVVAYMDAFFPEGVLRPIYRELLAEASTRGVFYEGE